jgi:hypothetical protein
MKSLYIVLAWVFLAATSCVIEEEPILLINPTAEISAHIKDQKIYATVLINVNPQVLTPGNIPTIFEFSGELAIFNTITGNIIDSNAFDGGGLSQVYTVTADTVNHERFIVIASGAVNAYADTGSDGDSSNDRLISTGDFYQEAQYLVSELINPPAN